MSTIESHDRVRARRRPPRRTTSSGSPPDRSTAILIGAGALLTVVFVVAGCAADVGQQLRRRLRRRRADVPDRSSSRTRPRSLEDGRDDLVAYAEEQVTTGNEAEAYASYINGHLPELSYAQQGGPEREARAALEEARAAGEDEATVAGLQATVDELTTERDTTFKGETLRGLLLSTYAWSTVGTIAGYAAWAAFAAARADGRPDGARHPPPPPTGRQDDVTLGGAPRVPKMVAAG